MNMNTVKETIEFENKTLTGTDQPENDSSKFEIYRYYESKENPTIEEVAHEFIDNLDENTDVDLEYVHHAACVNSCTRHFLGEWVEDRIKKRLDDHGDSDKCQGDEALERIYKRLNEDISEEVRVDLTIIANILMHDSEEYSNDISEKSEAVASHCSMGYFWYSLRKGMYKPDSVC